MYSIETVTYSRRRLSSLAWRSASASDTVGVLAPPPPPPAAAAIGTCHTHWRNMLYSKFKPTTAYSVCHWTMKIKFTIFQFQLIWYFKKLQLLPLLVSKVVVTAHFMRSFTPAMITECCFTPAIVSKSHFSPALLPSAVRWLPSLISLQQFFQM